MSRAAICVVGSLNMDLVVRAPHLPQPGETLSGGPFATYPGGKGANQAVAAARLGCAVSMVGRVGDDDFGSALRGGMDHEGIDVNYVVTHTGVASGIALITVQQDGQNTIVIAPGANGELTPNDVDAATETIVAARVLVLQLESPLPTVQRAAELAHAAGVPVLLNPAPAQPLPAELLRSVDYLVPNEHETTLLLEHLVQGLPKELHFDTKIKMLRSIAGVKYVVATLGSQGAALVGDDDQLHVVSPHAVTPIDATAAGDAFVGAFAVALAEGHSPTEALHWGNAAGAVAVTRAGAQPSLPTRDELQAMLRAE